MVVWCDVVMAALLINGELLLLPRSLMSIAPCNKVALPVNGELLLPPGLLMSIAPCNKVRKVARRQTVMFDNRGMNDETSATI